MFKLDHVGVVVKDAEVSSEFYRRAFHAEVSGGMQDERLKLVFLMIGGQTIELVQYLQSDVARGAGIVDHIAFSVEDMDAALAHVISAGAKPLFDAPRETNGKKIMFLTGPDGERLELVQILGK